MKKQLLFLLVGIILSIAFLSPLSAFTQTNTDTRLITKTKAKVESVGVGSVVSIRLQKQKKVDGQYRPDKFR